MKPHPRPPYIRKTIKWGKYGGAALAVLLVVVFAMRQSRPWLVLKDCRVVRIQVIDYDGRLEIDSTAPGSAITPAQLERVASLLAAAECRYSQVLPRSTTRPDAMERETGTVFLDLDSHGHTYLLRVDDGGWCRLQESGAKKTYVFLTSRRLYGKVAGAVGSKAVENPD